MPKPPLQQGATAQKLEATNSSVLRLAFQAQVFAQSLPPHLDCLLDEPWSPEASRLIDLWLLCCEREGVK